MNKETTKEVISDIEAKLDKQEKHLTYLKRQQQVTQKRYEKCVTDTILTERQNQKISSDVRSTIRSITGLTINLAQKKKEIEYYDRER